MGCMKLKDTEYEGKVVEMNAYYRIREKFAKNKKKQPKQNIQKGQQSQKHTVESVDEEQINKIAELAADKTYNLLLQKEQENTAIPSPQKKGRDFLVLLGALLGAFASIAGVLAIYISIENSLDEKFDTINQRIDLCATKKDIDEMSTEVSEIKEYLYYDGGVKSQIGAIYEKLGLPKIFLSNYAEFAMLDVASVERNDISHSSTPIDANTKIGTDASGNVYIAEELVNETVLFMYNENNKDIFFLGQYNENYHWDGYCVTNQYEADGSLSAICESHFDDGKRIDYKTLSLSDLGEWTYADRVCGNDGNSGVSIIYAMDYNKIKDFTESDVEITDILYTMDVLDFSKEKRLIKYYHGNTVNGAYVDASGNAYEAKYNDDGTIKTLYVGQFDDASFNDRTGHAWDIAYSEESGSYYYNTGEFKDGSAVINSDEPISIDEINEIISDYEAASGQEFKCDLLWKEKE